MRKVSPFGDGCITNEAWGCLLSSGSSIRRSTGDCVMRSHEIVLQVGNFCGDEDLTMSGLWILESGVSYGKGFFFSLIPLG